MESLNEDERKLLGLMKCWTKLSLLSGRDGGTHNAFIRDWKALQVSIKGRNGWKNYKQSYKIINEVEKHMEDYMNNITSELD
tara:strand:- start:35 stop:280 length:246 start_codon:yes stop_codon:yes gene_type:complete